MRLETLSAKETWAPVVFIGIQLAAILMYGSLPNWAASDVHQLTLILYGLIAARLFRGAWVYSRNRSQSRRGGDPLAIRRYIKD
ncbi:MAG: hypothetical protein OXI46_00035, partial [Gemmatimonadota bacterium]|nr:hypothetical protein [Gemmatimonadota bacterium]